MGVEAALSEEGEGEKSGERADSSPGEEEDKDNEEGEE
jgi:hypothetical protein